MKIDKRGIEEKAMNAITLITKKLSKQEIRTIVVMTSEEYREVYASVLKCENNVEALTNALADKARFKVANNTTRVPIQRREVA